MAAVSPARANALLLGVMTFGQLLADGGQRARARPRRPPSPRSSEPPRGPRWPPSDPWPAFVQDVAHFFRDARDDVESAKLAARGHATRGRARADEAVAGRRERAACGSCSACTRMLVPKPVGALRDHGTARAASQRVLLVDRGQRRGPPTWRSSRGGRGGTGRRRRARVRARPAPFDPNSGAAGDRRSRAEGMIVGRAPIPSR